MDNVYRKLEQEHKEKLAAVRSELMKEMDQIQQQAGLQREELEAEIQKIREDESFLRDHLTISVKVTEAFYDSFVMFICLFAPVLFTVSKWFSVQNLIKISHFFCKHYIIICLSK